MVPSLSLLSYESSVSVKKTLIEKKKLIFYSHRGDSHKWKFVMLFLFANALACVVISIMLNIVDWRRVGKYTIVLL